MPLGDLIRRAGPLVRVFGSAIIERSSARQSDLPTASKPKAGEGRERRAFAIGTSTGNVVEVVDKEMGEAQYVNKNLADHTS